MAVPEEKVFIQTIEVPKVDKHKIMDVIHWQAEKLISFSFDNVYLDFRVVDEKNEKLKIVVTAVLKEVVDSLVLALERVGLEIVGVDSLSDALARFFAHVPHHLYALIYIEEPGIATVIIAKNSIARISTVVNFGTNTALLENKIKETIQYYLSRKEPTKKINELIFFGEIGSINFNHLPERLDVSVKRVDIQEMLGKKYPDELNSYIPNFGLYSNHTHAPSINLLPPAIIKAKESERIALTVGAQLKLFSFGLIFLTLITTALLGWQLISKIKVKADANDYSQESIIPNVETVEQKVVEINNQLAIMKQLLVLPQTSIAALVNKIVESPPKDITLTDILFTAEKKEIVISGIAIDRSTMLTFKQDLSVLDGIDKVILPLQNYNFSQNIPFKINLYLK